MNAIASVAERLGARVFSLVPARAVTGPFAAALAPSAAAFSRALHDPRAAQEHALARIAAEVHALRGVRALADLRALPLTHYDDIGGDMERIAAGDRTALTRSPVVRFERSGGSSGAQKLLPMTRPFLDEMNRALQPWLFSLTARTPGVGAGCAYWSISPIGQKESVTAGGIPVGAVSDTDYFPGALRALVSRVLAAPDALGRITDVERCRYVTLRVLLERTDLALISVWSPTFLTLLMDALDRHLDALLDDLAHGTCRVDGDGDVIAGLPLRAQPERARHLRNLADARPLTGRDLWPQLALLSMWTDAAAARFVDEARARFPGVPVQGKGLLAVEGVVSVPWQMHPDPVLAVRSHVIELLGDDGETRFVHEARAGESYEVVLTTSAGLVRYRLGDRVTVVGRIGATPCVRFIGRAGMVSDLVGEKLSAAFVGAVLDELCRGARFCMLAPSTRVPGSPAGYTLYVEGIEATPALAERIDARLSEGHPYRYARSLGQLGPVRVVGVHDGARAYERGCIARGQRAGDIKPTPLHRADGWDEIFFRPS